MCTSKFCVYYLVLPISNTRKECFMFMKKYLALMVAVLMLVCAGTAFGAGHSEPIGPESPDTPVEPETPIVTPPAVSTDAPLTPETPSDNPEEQEQPEDSGSEEAKTSEAAVATSEEQEQEQVVVEITEEIEVPQLSANDIMAIVVEMSFAEANETPAQTAERLQPKVEATEEQTTSFTDVLQNATKTNEETGETVAQTNEEKGSEISQQLADAGIIDESTKEVWGCMVESYLTGIDQANEGASEENQVQPDFAAFMEQAQTALAQLAANEEAAMSNLGLDAGVSTSAEDVEEAPADDDDAADANEFATQVAAHEAQNGGDAADAGKTYPVGKGSKVRFKTRSVATQKIDIAKLLHQAVGQAKTLFKAVVTGAFRGAALDTTVNGSAVLLNSAGNPTDHVPGYGEYDISASTGERVMVIPGYVKVAFYGEPSFDYTPYVATSTEAVEAVASDEVTTKTETVVTGTEIRTQTVTIPVYDAMDTGGYSTSFGDLKDYFKAQEYNTAVGRYIVAGEDGVWSATADSGDLMLSTYKRAVVRTLPKIAVKDTADGVQASDVADYVIKVRLSIPKNTEKRVVSGDDLLEFYPNGLTRVEDGTVYPQEAGTAEFLDSTGRAPLTDEMVMQVAAGTLGEAIDDNSQGYDAFVVMNLRKQSADAEPYKPVLVVKRAEIVSSETPGGETPGGETPGGETPGGETPGGETPGGETPGGETPGGETPTEPGSVGSSGGGCSAGFTALALAVLGGFIAARKK